MNEEAFLMKRMMILLLALLLLAFPAQGEENVGDKLLQALYRIVLRTDEGDTTLGAGVLFVEKDLLLTAEYCCQEGALYAIGRDGEFPVVYAEMANGGGAAVLQLAGKSAGEPLLLAEYDASVLPWLFGATREGALTSKPLTSALEGKYRDMTALVLRSEEGLLPGSVVVDANGGIVAMVVSQQTEGLGMYVALDPEGLVTTLRAPVDGIFPPAQGKWENAALTITWEDEERTDGQYAIIVSSDENEYYTWFDAASTERSQEIFLSPGHAYEWLLQWVPAGGKVEPDWDRMQRVSVPAGTFTAYEYQQRCCLAAGPKGSDDAQDLPPMQKITHAAIFNEKTDVYLQVDCTYKVDEWVTLPMSVELVAPDGQFFFATYDYRFAPDGENGDSYALPVQELFDYCRQYAGGTLPLGDYVIRYAFNGQIAGEYAFTVEESAVPEQKSEETDVGFITDLAVTADKGAINVSWAEADLPEGANVTVFCLYDGNTYYTYQPYKNGETEAQFFSVPGRGIAIWAVWSMSEEVVHAVPQRAEDVVSVAPTPEAPFMDNGFTNMHISVVTSTDAAAAMRNALLPVAPITREALTAPGTYVFFQTRDSYQVSETSSNHSLVLVLCTPDGMCFVEYGYYTFDVSLQASDMWLRDLTALFEGYESFGSGEPWPAGEYRVLYCIDGQIAGEYDFTLE